MDKLNLTKLQVGALVTLRVFIGWHFLYEGIIKIMNPNWSAASFLNESKGIFSWLFTWIALNTGAMGIVDFVNQWLLTIIGTLLIAGLFSRITAYSGMVLIMLYYVAAPPLIGYNYSMPTEGSYLIVNKNLIEAAALLILAVFPTGKYIGLDILLVGYKSRMDITHLTFDK